MKKSEFVEKFNSVYDGFLESEKAKEIYNSIENRSYTPTELVALTANISHQLCAQFVFEILSHTLEFEKE